MDTNELVRALRARGYRITKRKSVHTSWGQLVNYTVRPPGETPLRFTEQEFQHWAAEIVGSGTALAEQTVTISEDLYTAFDLPASFPRALCDALAGADGRGEIYLLRATGKASLLLGFGWALHLPEEGRIGIADLGDDAGAMVYWGDSYGDVEEDVRRWWVSSRTVLDGRVGKAVG